MMELLEHVLCELSKADIGSSDISIISQDESVDMQSTKSLLSDEFRASLTRICRWSEKCQLQDNDILVVAIIVASMHLNLSPTFDLSIQSVLQGQIITNSNLSTDVNRGGAYPSLSFLNTEKNASITISIVSVFGEMVVYAAKKVLDISNEEANQRKDNEESISANNNKQKKKILTLYLTVSQYISKSIQNKPNENLVTKNCNEIITIGTYDVKFQLLSDRLSRVLLLPLTDEK